MKTDLANLSSHLGEQWLNMWHGFVFEQVHQVDDTLFDHIELLHVVLDDDESNEEGLKRPLCRHLHF